MGHDVDVRDGAGRDDASTDATAAAGVSVTASRCADGVATASENRSGDCVAEPVARCDEAGCDVVVPPAREIRPTPMSVSASTVSKSSLLKDRS